MSTEQEMLEHLEGTFTAYQGIAAPNQFQRVSREPPIKRPVENPTLRLPAAPHCASIVTLNPWVYDGRTVTLADIKTVVSRHYNIPLNEIISARREFRLVRCRMVYYWLARELTAASFPMIGRHCGMRDHTTVMSGLRNVKRRWPQFRDVIEKLRGELNS